MGKSVLPHLNCISEISVEMGLNLLHLAGSSLKWLWKICLHTLVFIFKICLLGSFFFCVSVTLMRQIHHQMDAALFTWYFEWQISVTTEGFEVIFQELQHFPALYYQFSHWSRDTTCSLTSCRVVEGKIQNSLDAKLCCASIPGVSLAALSSQLGIFPSTSTT